MKITEYEKVQSLSEENILLLDGPDGTKGMFANYFAKSIIALLGTNGLSADVNDSLWNIIDEFIPKEQRRMLFRGKNLGTTLTAEQHTNIQNGTFKGFFLGDYWVISGVTWRIVDFNYWLNCGDASFTKPHLVMMPDANLYNAQMNATNITDGGYVNSVMYTTHLEQAKTIIDSAFGTAVLTHRELLVNAVTSGYPSAGAWFDSTVELPNENMMYGSYIFTPGSTGTVTPYRYTINKSQLALFQVCPRFITTRQNYWLRDVVSTAAFAFVGSNGLAHYNDASYTFGVRPVFCIG